MYAVKFAGPPADLLGMEFFAEGLSALMGVFSVAMVLAGVMKLFQIHTALTEIKEVLQSGSRPTAAPITSTYAAPQAARTAAPVTPAQTQAAPTNDTLYSMGSGEAMLRALDLQMKAEDGDALTPEVVDPSERR